MASCNSLTSGSPFRGSCLTYHVDFVRMPVGAWVNLRQRVQGAPDPHRHMQDYFHSEAKSSVQLLCNQTIDQFIGLWVIFTRELLTDGLIHCGTKPSIGMDQMLN